MGYLTDKELGALVFGFCKKKRRVPLVKKVFSRSLFDGFVYKGKTLKNWKWVKK